MVIKNIKEYKINPINDSDFEEWKSLWDGNWESIPEQIHDYVRDVLIKRSDEAYGEWLSLVTKKS